MQERDLLRARSALIVVDVQNDFADPAGALFVPGGDGVAARVAALMDQAERSGTLVVCSQDWHPPRTPHFREFGGPWPQHCVRDSWGAELHPLLPQPAAIVLKGEDQADGYSAFSTRDLRTDTVVATTLRQILAKEGIEAVTVVGLALDVCVRATALDAVALGLSTSLIAGATAAVELTPGAGRQALEELRQAGVVIA